MLRDISIYLYLYNTGNYQYYYTSHKATLYALIYIRTPTSWCAIRITGIYQLFISIRVYTLMLRDISIYLYLYNTGNYQYYYTSHKATLYALIYKMQHASRCYRVNKALYADTLQ